MVVELCRFDAADREAWDDYVQRAPEAVHSHLSGWGTAIEQSYGHRALYLWASDHGKIKGVLPLILLRGILFGRSLVSLPFLDDGGICADDQTTIQELYAAGLRLANEHRADLLDLRHRRASGLGLPLQDSKVTLVLELPRDPDQAWCRLDAKVRNQVRKALKSGLAVSWHGRESLDRFYDVFVENMRDLGSPVHSRKFFATILEEFSESARLILVSDGSRTVGGGVCFFFKDSVMMPWASSRRADHPKCPNNLLYWEAIRWACQEGFRCFDFGRSSRGSGTYHFKRQWGAADRPLVWEIWRRRGQRNALVRSSSARYAFAARAWKRLPVPVTRICGPVLRRQMSN
jgi:FemAB-related protein (PEP-CTERM system-associated)